MKRPLSFALGLCLVLALGYRHHELGQWLGGQWLPLAQHYAPWAAPALQGLAQRLPVLWQLSGHIALALPFSLALALGARGFLPLSWKQCAALGLGLFGGCALLTSAMPLLFDKFAPALHRVTWEWLTVYFSPLPLAFLFLYHRLQKPRKQA